MTDPSPAPSNTLSPAQGLRLIPIPRLVSAGKWRAEALRSLDEPLLLWFTRGQGRITLGGVTRGYGPHNAVFVPAGMMHGFEVGPHVFGTAVFFGAGCDLPLPARALHLRVREQPAQVELTHILENIQRESESALPGHDRAARHHLGLLGIWIERQEAAQGAPEAPDAATRLVTRFATLIERDFREGHTVADYAAALGVTPTHLTRVCRQRSGRSAHALVQERLLYEARRLLTESDLPVGEIARTLGFTSAGYFTRAFQNGTGQTPSAFRKARPTPPVAR